MIQNLKNCKCVLIVDSDLPTGEQANIAAILAMTIGAKNNMIVGNDLPDADNTILLHAQKKSGKSMMRPVWMNVCLSLISRAQHKSHVPMMNILQN